MQERHDLRFGTGPPAEFRRVSMRSLSHWSGQQQHLLQWLQALGGHKKCSWLKRLKKDPDYRCTQCQGTARPLDNRSNELLVRLSIEDLDLILKERRLWWYGHVEHSNGAVKTAFDIQVDGKRGPGRPKMTWKQLTERDCREWKLSAINPHDRHTWRSGVRSAMHAASQLSGRGPLVWMLPLYLHVNQKSDYDIYAE